MTDTFYLHILGMSHLLHESGKFFTDLLKDDLYEATEHHVAVVACFQLTQSNCQHESQV